MTDKGETGDITSDVPVGDNFASGTQITRPLSGSEAKQMLEVLGQLSIGGNGSGTRDQGDLPVRNQPHDLMFK